MGFCERDSTVESGTVLKILTVLYMLKFQRLLEVVSIERFGIYDGLGTFYHGNTVVGRKKIINYQSEEKYIMGQTCFSPCIHNINVGD
jgi:hypothetical protein